MTSTPATASIEPASVRRKVLRAVARPIRAVLATVPTRRLVVATAILAPVWMASGTPTGGAVAIFVTAVLVAAVVLDVVTLPARWQLEMERVMPERVGLGDAAEGSYVLRAVAGRALRVSLYDDLPRGVRADASRFGPRVVRVDAPCVLPVELEGAERGTWPLGRVVVRVDGWLGLVRRTFRWPMTDQVMVVPSMAGVRRYRLLSLHHRLRDLGLRTIRRRGDGSAFSGLREYVVGDEPRRIDWKATARRGVLISREYTVEQGQTVMLSIDCGRMMTQLEGDVPRFEYALS